MGTALAWPLQNQVGPAWQTPSRCASPFTQKEKQCFWYFPEAPHIQ